MNKIVAHTPCRVVGRQKSCQSIWTTVFSFGPHGLVYCPHLCLHHHPRQGKKKHGASLVFPRNNRWPLPVQFGLLHMAVAPSTPLVEEKGGRIFISSGDDMERFNSQGFQCQPHPQLLFCTREERKGKKQKKKS